MVQNKNSLFDGLIDEVRLSSAALDVPSLLYTQESITEKTLGYWRFDPVPGRFADSSSHQYDITRDDRPTAASDPRRAAFADLCHILLNSNEFLYVD